VEERTFVQHVAHHNRLRARAHRLLRLPRISSSACKIAQIRVLGIDGFVLAADVTG
jgi:hypothetical protein